jgi:hypothetical protein
MSSKVVFRGSEIREWKGLMDDDGKVTTRVRIKADFSEPVMEAMEWERIPDGVDKADLHGLLRGRTFGMTPTDKAIKKHAFEMDITEVRDFKYTSLSNKDGDVQERFITFVIVSAAVGVSQKIEEYMRVVGRAPAAIQVSYETETQQSLPGTETAAVGGDAEGEEAEERAPLDNILNMAGSGRQKKKRTRGEMSAEVSSDDDPEARARVEKAIDASLQ